MGAAQGSAEQGTRMGTVEQQRAVRSDKAKGGQTEERAVVRQRAVKKALSRPSRAEVGVAYPEEWSGGGRSRPLLLLKLLPRMSCGGPLGQRSSRVPMALGDVPRDGGEKGPVVVERGDAARGEGAEGAGVRCEPIIFFKVIDCHLLKLFPYDVAY